jgi:hypothetical protein
MKTAQRKSILEEKEKRLKEVGMEEGHFDGAKKEDPVNEGSTNSSMAKIDEFLSGNYLIGKIMYKYTKETGMKQRLNLLRREWPVSLNQLPGQKK